MNKIMGFLCLFLLISYLGCSHSKPSPAAKDAYLALKKIEAKIETGINYMEYLKLVGDANFEVKKFTENEKGKNLQEINRSINLVLLHYILASQVWSAKIKSYYGEFNKIKDDINSLCPNVEIGSMEETMQNLWKEASSELQKISKHFN